MERKYLLTRGQKKLQENQSPEYDELESVDLQPKKRKASQKIKKDRKKKKNTNNNLEDLKKFALINSSNLWTNSQVESLLLPFIKDKNEEHWKEDEIEERMKILFLLPVDGKKLPSKVLKRMQSLEVHYARIREKTKNLCVLRPEPLTPDGLFPYFSPMIGKSISQWETKDVQELVKYMTGANGVECVGSEPGKAAAWIKFSPLWSNYLTLHPEIAKHLDPVYVIADVGGAALPATWAASIAGYPPPGCPHPAPVPVFLLPYFWSFVNDAQAHHFIGWMQASNPGLRMVTMDTPAVPNHV